MPAKAGNQVSSRRKPGTSKALDPGACPGRRSGIRRGDNYYESAKEACFTPLVFYSGMIPCLFAGRSSTFPFNCSNVLIR